MAPEATATARSIRRVVSTLADVVAEGPDLIAYRDALDSASRVYALLAPILRDRPTEEFWVLLVDGKHRVIGVAQVSVGSLNSTLVHPREIFGAAVRMGAAAIVAVHNHPSGDPEPSAEDLVVTRRLIEAGKVLGIPLLDHVICGTDRFVSLRERLVFP